MVGEVGGECWETADYQIWPMSIIFQIFSLTRELWYSPCWDQGRIQEYFQSKVYRKLQKRNKCRLLSNISYHIFPTQLCEPLNFQPFTFKRNPCLFRIQVYNIRLQSYREKIVYFAWSWDKWIVARRWI